ncbi:Outer membrane protein P5 precursor [Tsuneonella dongtanensis]|uniref:Outer membrane protein P5 n=1 Tax=Tsuneonella dongtanensis TaxID=692370 RepID=A0A1B2AGX7_9SPHN|nr:OmpA family protein [Tsuneonella dongtanensis]ANY21396.1 Outer membrane protein P5 precursor [Tsuneonella dongtanensis]
MIRGGIALGAALLVGGCATDRVTLLENEGGNETGSVAVLASDGRETVIDRANSQAALRDGATRVRSVSEIKPEYTAVLDSLPPPVRTFSIPFESGQSAIRDDQRQVLEEIRTELVRRPGAQVEVAAFTDSIGSEELNAKLSLERAQNVAGELRGYGFSIDEADAIGRGEYEAKAKYGDEVERAEFRRVDVIVR